mmetsp:Transcript_157/g.527  ORF Transcript_157/g.527 Transcript_157/m.527 type:complete len:226 (+) Transcript_157:374-1051(+)
MTKSIPFSFAIFFKCSSAFSFSINTGSNASYTFCGGADFESPVPIEVTKTNFLMPFATQASINAMFPSESAFGSAGVPPTVDTTASYSSTKFNAFFTDFGSNTSPLTKNPPTDSISFLLSSCLCNTVTHVPAAVICRNTSMATPLPPATRTEMLSGSKSDFIVTRVLLMFFFFTKRDDDDDDGSPFRREEKEEEEDRTGVMHRVKEEEESISVSLLCACVRASLK